MDFTFEQAKELLAAFGNDPETMQSACNGLLVFKRVPITKCKDCALYDYLDGTIPCGTGMFDCGGMSSMWIRIV